MANAVTYLPSAWAAASVAWPAAVGGTVVALGCPAIGGDGGAGRSRRLGAWRQAIVHFQGSLLLPNAPVALFSASRVDDATAELLSHSIRR